MQWFLAWFNLAYISFPMEEIKVLVNTGQEISFLFLNFRVCVWNALATQQKLHSIKISTLCAEMDGHCFQSTKWMAIYWSFFLSDFSLRIMISLSSLMAWKGKKQNKASMQFYLLSVYFAYSHTNTWLHFLFPKFSIICGLFAQKLSNREALFAHECFKAQCEGIAVES